MLSFYLSLLDAPEDKDKFTEIYIAYRKDAYKAAYAILHNASDAEDATHDAFIAIAKNFHRFLQIGENAYKPYLCRAARNCALNIFNQTEKAHSREEKYYKDLFDAPVKTALDDICTAETVSVIIECIEELPEKYRDILYMYYVEECKAAQIAKTFGLDKSLVQKQIYRGKQLLIILLGKKGITPHE